MKIIIVGCGKVGYAIAQQLTQEKHDITLVDDEAAHLSRADNTLDAMCIHGNGASISVLMEAGAREADLVIAVTGVDETNLVCSLIAKSVGAQHTIARVRNPEYTEQIFKMRETFGLSMLINPENQAATEIDRLLKYPGFLRRDTFAKGRTEIVELRVDASSKLCNVRLVDLQSIIRCKVLVCAVLRGGQAITPGGDFMLREGDRLFITALSENLTTLLKNLGILTRQVRRVMLCGGGRVSYYLANRLLKAGISCVIVEQNLTRCKELCALLPGAEIIHGDVSDQYLLESEGLSQCDALVTLTGLDELNMIVSLYGISKGVPQVITKVGHADNHSIMSNLSLGSYVCPKELCCNNIVRYVRAMQNQTGAAVSVHSIADGQAEAMEFLADESTRFCGVPLKDIKLKSNVLVVSVSHGAATEIANGDTMFHAGDTIIVVTNSGVVLRQLNDIFA